MGPEKNKFIFKHGFVFDPLPLVFNYSKLF